MTRLQRISADYLRQGDKFYLTEKGDYGDTFVKFHGFGSRPEKDPVTGELTGKTQRTLVYTCEAGYKDEIPIDFPVYRARKPI